MNLDELGQQLQGKRRTVADLARFISTRTDQNPNYTVLLGAGCSISSSVRSATELTKEWRGEICKDITEIEEQRTHLKQKCGEWYDPNREYSSLFEKKYDLQRQRRMFVEKEVSGKTPSLGYAYLTSLVHQNYFNTIFTTNFDDLVNEAFYLYSDQRPIVCAHDSSINSITVTSKRPKIIKLHGDYLFDDLKSTARETESLEQNMKAKFSEFAKNYGLIVVGYAGGDRSIMDVISTLLKNDEYFKGGIYWCLRSESEVSEDLRKLMWKEKVYFVEIEGFDELFSELHSIFNDGEVLPISTISVSRRPAEIVNRLISMQTAYPSKSLILKKAQEQLIKQSKRTTLMDMMLPTDKDEATNKKEETFSDEELITQIEIQNLISSGNYRDAINKGLSATKPKIRSIAERRILNLVIQSHQYLDEFDEAVSVVEKLISLQPHNPAPYLLKSDILLDKNKKLIAIEKAIEINPYYVRSYLKKAQLHESQSKYKFGEDRKKAISAAHEALDVGISRDPSIRNPCWVEKFNFIKEHERDKKIQSEELNKIINLLSEQDPDSYRVLSMRMNILSGEKNHTELEKLLTDIQNIKQRSDPESHVYLDEIRLKALAKFNQTHEIKNAISSIETTHDLLQNSDLAVIVAKLKREKLGLDQEAATLMQNCLEVEFDGDVFILLITSLIDLEKIQDAETLFEKWHHKLSPDASNKIKVSLFEAKNDYDGALNEMQRLRTQTGSPPDVNMIYIMLKKGSYKDVIKVAQEILTAANFSPEAEGEIINYEIACKKLKNKVQTSRLETVLNFTSSSRVKAASYALLNKKNEMLENIKKAMEDDKTFRFDALRWPAFDDFRSDIDFVRAISI